VLDVDPSIPSTITAFGPGYIDKPLEKIVGLQVCVCQDTVYP
jgi:formate C-acetyltransferase